KWMSRSVYCKLVRKAAKKDQRRISIAARYVIIGVVDKPGRKATIWHTGKYPHDRSWCRRPGQVARPIVFQILVSALGRRKCVGDVIDANEIATGIYPEL